MIEKLENNKYKASINLGKSNEVIGIFSNKQIAEIWLDYKKDLIEEIRQFDVPLEETITLETACDLKIGHLNDKKASHRSVNDILIIKKEFVDFLRLPLKDITHEIIFKRASVMLNEEVTRGGNGDGVTGRFSKSSPYTVLRKFRSLSSIFGLMIEDGMNITNPVLNVIAYIKKNTKEIL